MMVIMSLTIVDGLRLRNRLTTEDPGLNGHTLNHDGLGHLCKMLGIKNTYCKLYEDEMARLRVERPDLEEEDDEGAFSEIFGGGDET